MKLVVRAYSDVSDQVFAGHWARRLLNKTPRYISRVKRALWLVHLARRISLHGPLNSKVCFDRQNISSRKIWTDLRKSTPTRKKIKTKKQISQSFESDSSSFWVGQAASREIRLSTTNITRVVNQIISLQPKGRRILWKDKIRVQIVCRVLRKAGWWKF